MRRLSALVLIICATPALAHHPLGGLPMETFQHGLLSGIGHPVLGFDHLFFVMAAGVLASMCGQATRGTLAYVAAMLLGTLAVSLGATVPVAEAMIALSLVAVGGTLAAGRFASKTTAVWLFAGFGLFHGAAFGGTIAGQEGSVGLPVLLGYLIGLGTVQWLIARGAGALAQRASAMQVQLGGAMAAGVGVFLCLEMIEGVILG